MQFFLIKYNNNIKNNLLDAHLHHIFLNGKKKFKRHFMCVSHGYSRLEREKLIINKQTGRFNLEYWMQLFLFQINSTISKDFSTKKTFCNLWSDGTNVFILIIINQHSAISLIGISYEFRNWTKFLRFKIGWILYS